MAGLPSANARASAISCRAERRDVDYRPRRSAIARVLATAHRAIHSKRPPAARRGRDSAGCGRSEARRRAPSGSACSQFPRAGAGDGSLHLAPLITRVADDALDEREAASCLPQQRLCTVSILDACRMDADGQQQAERIGQDVALAAKHLLASVIAGRVERSPPLTAPFAVWLSMIAVVGLASLPALSRTST